MKSTKVYVGIGGNIGDSKAALQKALEKMASLEGVSQFQASSFYETTPVSSIPQRSYINAACCFKTTDPALELFEKLQNIETEVGKVPKTKEDPRVIDLDILFFGEEIHTGPRCQIPHPRWQERLFVLIPLSDLAKELNVPLSKGGVRRILLSELIENHLNLHDETVIPLCEEVQLCTMSQ